jgi:hypothetical protein
MSTSPQRTGSAAHTRITEPSREGLDLGRAGSTVLLPSSAPPQPNRPSTKRTNRVPPLPLPLPSALGGRLSLRQLRDGLDRTLVGATMVSPPPPPPISPPPLNLRVALPMHAPAVENHPGLVLNLLLSSVRLVGLRGAASRRFFASVGDRASVREI